MEIYSLLVQKIVREQQLIIGPLAIVVAQKVNGITIIQAGKIIIEGEDKAQIIDSLVGRYEQLFGKVSHEVCKKAVKDLLITMKKEDIPVSLQ